MANDGREARYPGVNQTPSRRMILKGAGAAGLTAAFAGVFAADARAAGDYRKLDVTATDYAFKLPGRISAGYTEITLHNEGSEEHHAMFMRLNQGTTAAEFLKTAQEKDPAALFALASSAGGPGSVDHGQASTVIANLTPGEYFVICIVPDAQGMPHYKMGMLAPLTVTRAATTGSSPAADLTIDLVDFAFGKLPRQVHKGKRVWKVLNTGAQLHEMVINRLAPGVTFEQAKAVLIAPSAAKKTDSTKPAAIAAAPFDAVAGVAPMSPRSLNWAVLDLEDGEYFAICYVPDPRTGTPHFDLGMIAPLTVKS
jgi:plastocyanin